MKQQKEDLQRKKVQDLEKKERAILKKAKQ